ncbi:MAG: SDR family NAD(P)-dependent oxidoreductase [Gammaproteobacteria bacterium]|nr:SDR family NAD(P)-dependent oxidoreductase [Gammaproteobacteria bacterium]
MDLTGKRVIVTGGAGILGQAVGATCQRNGAAVVMLDIVEGFESDLGDTHTVDLTDIDAVRRCVDAVGNFDVVCNIAGGFDMGLDVSEITDEHWDAMFDINVTTLRNVLRVTLPRLVERGGGSIVNVGALGALQGQAAMGAYTAAKSVVMRLTEAASAEVRQHGVNVNAVLPSLIDTPRNRSDLPNADFATWVSPGKLANVVCFLASDAASDVHGVLLPVAGRV